MIRRGPSPERYYILSYQIIDKDLSAEALGVSCMSYRVRQLADISLSISKEI